MIAAYVERIEATPSTKTGRLLLNPAVRNRYKRHDRPEGRSWVNVVAGAGYYTDSPDLLEWEDIDIAQMVLAEA